MTEILDHLPGMQAGDPAARAAVEAWKPTTLLHELMREGLLQHKTGNLYGDGEQLSRFDRLDAYPLLKEPTDAGNAIVADALRGVEDATIVDLGAGTGRQLRKLLPHLDASRLTVVAVDLEKRALEACSVVCDSVTFVPVVGNVEDDKTWHDVYAAVRPESTVVVLSTFFMHHVVDAKKTWVLQKIASLRPKKVVLSEPDCDGCAEDLLDRFLSLQTYLIKVFAGMDVDGRNDDDLKRAVFGPVLRSVLGPDNYERFETRESWKSRFEEAGLAVEPGKEQGVIMQIVASA
jgi:SAM-dependent methyltransferase